MVLLLIPTNLLTYKTSKTYGSVLFPIKIGHKRHSFSTYIKVHVSFWSNFQNFMLSFKCENVSVFSKNSIRYSNVIKNHLKICISIVIGVIHYIIFFIKKLSHYYFILLTYKLYAWESISKNKLYLEGWQIVWVVVWWLTNKKRVSQEPHHKLLLKC